jgi:L-alanine-DL-glutamate epimerase-like enolase superfamily enzyme
LSDLLLLLLAPLPVARDVEVLSAAPFIEEIVATPFVLDADGMLPIPTGPGLGLDLDWDGITRFSRGG